MEVSSGLLIIQDKKILLIHPTNAPWFNSYSIPKGKVEGDESLVDAALRETFEETGITIDKDDIIDKDNPFKIPYTNKKGIVYKIVYYFIVKPNKPLKKADFKLNERETDWVGFLDKHNAEKRIFWRFAEMVNLIE